MSDFTSNFWTWFIAVPTLIGILALFWLNRWMTTPRKDATATPKTMGHVWDENLEEYNNPLPRWWLNMFYITLVFGLGYLALYPGLGTWAGLLNWTSRGQYEKEIDRANAAYGPLYEKYSREQLAMLAKDPEAMKTGARLFQTYCTVCHGSDARGATGFPNLRDDEWLYGGDPDTIKTTIMNGRAGVMPAWGAALGKDGVFDVAEFVISLSGRRVNENAAERGKVKFQQMCVACHGADGKGNKQMGAPDLTNDSWLYGGSQRAIMATIEKGRQGNMPAHAQFLGEAKVHLLAAYVYSLSQSPATAGKGGP